VGVVERIRRRAGARPQRLAPELGLIDSRPQLEHATDSGHLAGSSRRQAIRRGAHEPCTPTADRRHDAAPRRRRLYVTLRYRACRRHIEAELCSVRAASVTTSEHANGHVPETADTPQISVIVPTRNRSGLLRDLLGDLGSQDAADFRFEVLVVDNASRDDTRAVALAIAARDPRVRYIYEPARGASLARNRGIAEARAAIIAFIDDDVRPAADWLRVAWRTMTGHPEIDCLGGRIEPHWPAPPPAWLTPRLFGPLALQVGRSDGACFDREHASACLMSANFVCRASILRELGGFSPQFQRDEDRELNLRLWRAGKRGMHGDSLIVYAQVQPERLTRRYHRHWHSVTGGSHARLHYRDLVDRDGRLLDAPPSGRRLWGVPGFLYREFAGQAAEWGRSLARRQFEDAFYHECRLWYLAAYFRQRWRDHSRAQRAHKVRPRVRRPASIAML
jgi:glycosyltransferase involved in cell wall biosynthesis